jgi:hypothetical protein
VLSHASLISALFSVVRACFRLRRVVLPARCLHRPAPAMPASCRFRAFKSPGTFVTRGELTVLLSCLHAPYLWPQTRSPPVDATLHELHMRQLAQQLLPVTSLLDKRPTYPLAPVFLPERKVLRQSLWRRPFA